VRRHVEEWTGREGGPGSRPVGDSAGGAATAGISPATAEEGEGGLTGGSRPLCQAAALADWRA
jgi:hypothetical protein